MEEWTQNTRFLSPKKTIKKCFHFWKSYNTTTIHPGIGQCPGSIQQFSRSIEKRINVLVKTQNYQTCSKIGILSVQQKYTNRKHIEEVIAPDLSRPANVFDLS